MITPIDANGRGHEFIKGVNTFYAGLFDFDPIKSPDVLVPKLLRKTGDTWDLVTEFSPIWDDVKEEIHPDPADLAVSIINFFNAELEKIGDEGGTLTYNQRLILIFQMRLALVDGKLIIKSA
jgi:hypothetical protein